MTPARALALKWLRYNGVLKSLATLPPAMAYAGATLLGNVDRRRNSASVDALAAVLRQVFPDRARNPQVLHGWLNQHFAMLARESLDSFVMGRGPRVAEKIVGLRPGSLETLHRARAAERGVIIAMSHYSRVNMLLLALALAGEELGMLTMATDVANPDLDAVERRYINRKVGTLLRYIGGSWITVDGDLRDLYRALERGETLVILFDVMTADSRQRGLPAPFLGGTLYVAQGIRRLAQKTGAQVVYGVAHEQGYRIQAELRSLPEIPQAILPAAVAELEKDLIASPWLWWQWGCLNAIWKEGA